VIPVLDVDKGVQNCGSEESLISVARVFADTALAKADEIGQYYVSEDIENYTVKVHALKSSSRQIGAMELGNMAEALEKAGKADDIDTILADNDKAMSAFRALLDKMAAFYPDVEEDEGDKPPIDNEALKAFMDELEEYCDNLDLDGMEEISAKLKGYSFTDELSALIDSLNKAVSDIDTDECISIIDQIRVLADE
jgi:HPt (histidine-containing phosphotransfer) domain-containing protein